MIPHTPKAVVIRLLTSPDRVFFNTPLTVAVRSRPYLDTGLESRKLMQDKGRIGPLFSCGGKREARLQEVLHRASPSGKIPRYSTRLSFQKSMFVRFDIPGGLMFARWVWAPTPPPPLVVT
jgi:hypothetical protein